MKTYVKRQGEEWVETRQKNKQSRNEIVDGRCSRIGRQIERYDVDHGRECSADILQNWNNNWNCG